MDTPKYNCEYPPLTARRYGVMIHNGPNMTLVDPVELVLAHAFMTKTKELREVVIQNIQTSELLKTTTKFTLEVKPGEKKKALLSEFSPIEIAHGLEQKLREPGHHKLWWGSTERIIAKEHLTDKVKLESHAGGIILSGRVASKTKGWYEVMVEGPFRESRSQLNKIICDCDDSRFVRMKLGYENLTHMDLHAATLLRFAQENCTRLPGYAEQVARRGPLNIFTPFVSSPGLMVDTLVMAYIMRMTKSQLSRVLLSKSEIYDGMLINHIKAATSDFQVAPNREYTNIYHGQVLQFYDRMRNKLEAHGFRLNGYVFEQGQVAQNFELNKSDATLWSERIISDNHPPLIVRRHTSHEEQDIFALEADKPLWLELYKHPHERFDDKQRKKTSYEVRLPVAEGVSIPKEIFQDYGSALRFYFNDNVGELQRRLHAARASSRLSEPAFTKVMQMLHS